MDDQHKQNNLEENITEVIRMLPPAIHDYVTQGNYTVVAQHLMKKYGLRIDQGGILEREILLLLIGIDTPDEFTQALVEEAKIEEQVVGSIIQDMNDQVFVPLREAERKNGTLPQEQNSASTSPHPVTPPPAAPVSPLPIRMAMPPVRAAQPLPSGIPLPSEQINRISNIAPRSAMPPPPVNLPGSMPPAPAPAPAPQPKPIARPPITAYSSDPYREPIDEPISEM